MKCPAQLLLTLLLLLGVARADWPDFRGPTQGGRANSGTNLLGLPLTWSETNNVVWKTSIPHLGWSTPVVLGHQIWLTTAPENGHDFFALCVDADSGTILLNERLFHCDAPEPLGNDLNCYASPSPVLESGRVYVHFGSYGTACLDTSSFKVLWRRDDLPCRHYRGPGSSPVLFNDLLILTMDGVDVQYLVALDKRTGKTVWKTDRTAEWNDLGPDGKPMAEGDLRKAYSTPLIVPVNGTHQMISVGAKAAYGYDPVDGREIWKLPHGDFSAAARPLFANGIAYLCTGGGKGGMLAVRADGHGNVADTHLVWRSARGIPRMPSPLLVDGLIFLVNDGGIGSCLDAATGDQIWQERLGGQYAASPVYADGRIYFFNQTGTSTVINPSKRFEVLSTNKLDGGFMASPAVTGKAFILRTKTHLYRIESKP